MVVAELRRLRQLVDENRQLKQLVANPIVDKVAGGAAKKAIKPPLESAWRCPLALAVL
jgi:hypothetical protein